MVSDFVLKKAKARIKDYSIYVDVGLSLVVKSSGSKLWRYRYTHLGKPAKISLGKYPAVSLREAKEKALGYSKLVEQGVNPATQKKIQKIQQDAIKTFQEVAVIWHSKKYTDSNPRYVKLVMQRLKNYIFPILGNIPIQEIEAPELFNIIERIQETGRVDTGKKINSYCSMIFRYGVAKGYCKRDPTQDYRGMLLTKEVQHMPTFTDKSDISLFLKDIHNYLGTLQVQIALKISAYIFVRPSELAVSEWEYIDFDKSQWLIPAKHMKMKRDHLIPMSYQVKTLLEGLLPITGHCRYLFPSQLGDDRPMHSETVNKAIRRIDNGKYIGKFVSHGFRSMASTILNEHGFRSDIIEKQLAHQEKNKIRGAYNHAEYIEERIEMMQWYANYLDDLKSR